LAELRQAFRQFAAPARTTVLPPELGGLQGGEGGPPAEFGERGPGPGDLRLAVPGRHNRLNARAALAALGAAGFDLDAAAAALAGFPGVRRRLELKGRRGPVRVYDDYAHHPTEVRAALAGLRELEPRRLLAVFQPHL